MHPSHTPLALSVEATLCPDPSLLALGARTCPLLRIIGQLALAALGLSLSLAALLSFLVIVTGL
jgi:hypothetical protein